MLPTYISKTELQDLALNGSSVMFALQVRMNIMFVNRELKNHYISTLHLN
jgi:hypothetical protein